MGWNGGQGGWNDATGDTYPDWVEVAFAGERTIDEVDVFTVQDAITSPSTPTAGMTFALYGLTAYDVQYWTGSAWATVPNGSVTGNTKVWRKLSFAAVTTTKVRVVINGALASYSRLVEVEAWGGEGAAAGAGTEIRWLVSDQLGTPRMVADQTGSLAGMTRHDYLPFGEELSANVGGRTAAQGYGAVDNLRQQFTGYERDAESGLDYAQARYYASAQGRFTSVDPFTASARLGAPQTWNRYSYVLGNPLRLSDPSGMTTQDKQARSQQESLPSSSPSVPATGLVAPVTSPNTAPAVAPAAPAVEAAVEAAVTTDLLLPALAAPAAILLFPATAQGPTLDPDLFGPPPPVPDEKDDNFGTATIHVYNPGVFEPGLPHFSVTVTHHGESFTTELVTDGTNHDAAYIETDTFTKIPNQNVTVPLPDARAALQYQSSVLGRPAGLFDINKNNCLTHVNDVLRAGGLPAPPGSTRGASYLRRLGVEKPKP